MSNLTVSDTGTTRKIETCCNVSKGVTVAHLKKIATIEKGSGPIKRGEGKRDNGFSIIQGRVHPEKFKRLRVKGG